MKRFIRVGLSLSLGIPTFILVPNSAQAQSLTLAEVLQATRSESPDVKILEAKLTGLEAKKSGATNIPAPMIGVSYMGTDGPFKSGDMREKPSFEISQTIPFPTKIFASRAASSKELTAGVASRNYELKIIEASAKAAFWNYYKAFNEQKYKREQVSVLKDHLKRLSRSPVSDTLTSSHILSIQNEISLMESEIDDAEFETDRARNVLFVYTGLSKEKLALPPGDGPLKFQEENLKSASNSFLIKKAEAEVEQSKSELSFAKSAYLPDFTLKYKWNSEFASVPRNQEVMLGIDLPFVFFWQPAAGVSQARAQLVEKEAMKKKAERESEAALSNFLGEVDVTKKKLIRLEKEILPRSEKRLKLAHSISFSDMQSLEQHREVLEDVLKQRLERVRLRSFFEKTLAELEVLRGEP